MDGYVTFAATRRRALQCSVLCMIVLPLCANAQTPPPLDSASDVKLAEQQGQDTIERAAATAAEQTSPGGPATAENLVEMFTKGQFFGDVRAIYFSSHNAFYQTGMNQDTISYGGGLGYRTASLYGFSLGVSGYLQRGINHSDNPAKVDGYLGPNLTAMGEAYVNWQYRQFSVTAGNQALDVPFASTYDWRMAPQLFQGVAAKYGDTDNYVTAFRMLRFKSYIDDSFKRLTTYNSNVDPFSPIGTEETSGFYGIGGMRTMDAGPVSLKGQAWYMGYLDYARMTYLEGQVTRKDGDIKPFAAAQFFYETGDGKELLGPVHSQVYGLQLGLKHNSLTLSLGYDYIKPNGNSYLNGALVTPYAHNVASGPLFAQPFLSSTQDLGAGNAYALDLNGAPIENLFIGFRYSFMDLKSSPAAPSLNQSEYLAYAIYSLSGKLKGFSIADFFALQSSPAVRSKFIQNRLTLQYVWGPQ
ncbi:OprD family outer membrane porin [Caballeronia sp. INDeC2]|uniref:OprD family outer membrane porin n=1 Tax=Caballeronia sp. INDeC2 TaxID=2921747 RepID=UPI002027F11B|nr:OprD family outer membrane porin [Caballeronia sp. INDeC2]